MSDAERDAIGLNRSGGREQHDYSVLAALFRTDRYRLTDVLEQFPDNMRLYRWRLQS